MLSLDRNSKWVIAVVCVLLLIGLSIRGYKASTFEKYDHDDLISFLAASSQLGHYHQFIDANAQSPQWLPSADWQQFFAVPANQSAMDNWRTIVSDLQTHDIHPPGYFLWLNSVIRAGAEISPQLGLISNVPFYVMNGLLLFWLGYRLFGRPQEALLALAVWALASATIDTSLAARQYEILTSFTLASTLIALSTITQARLSFGAIASLVALSFFGFLTNYQFLFHASALSIVLLIAHRQRLQPLVVYALASLLALAAALYLYPAILEQSQTVSEWNQDRLTDFSDRLKNALEEPFKFWIFGTLVLLYKAATDRAAFKAIPWVVYLLFGLNFLFIVGAYVSFVLPRHAMGDRYLASVWPFLALLLAGMIGDLWQRRGFQIAVVIALGLPAVKLLSEEAKHPPVPTALVGNYAIVADFDNRGSWPAIFLRLNPDQPTWVASQPSLIANQQWQAELAAEQRLAFYVSGNWPEENSSDQQQLVLDGLKERFEVEEIKVGDRNIRYFGVVRAD